METNFTTQSRMSMIRDARAADAGGHTGGLQPIDARGRGRWSPMRPQGPSARRQMMGGEAGLTASGQVAPATWRMMGGETGASSRWTPAAEDADAGHREGPFVRRRMMGGQAGGLRHMDAGAGGRDDSAEPADNDRARPPTGGE